MMNVIQTENLGKAIVLTCTAASDEYIMIIKITKGSVTKSARIDFLDSL